MSEPTLTTRLGESAQSLDVTRGFAAAQAPAEQAIAMARDPFARPVLLGLEQNADAVMPGWAHEQALQRLLLPEAAGEGLAALEGWEEAMARGHLKAVLHNAENVSAAAFDALDDWLAQLLCDSWPRSAPLLEPAARVFLWGSERGKESGRAAVMFLNSRLRGLHFLEDVQRTGHPWHKAWIELATPAQPASRRGLFIRRGDVAMLLEEIRNNFPELEQHFDPVRVALWVQDEAAANAPGWLGKGLWIALGLGVLIFSIRSLVS
ncbi:hypothetical protein [Novosphingobium sp. AAP83]|uniref:hypothetical protein n=1 Tax=Novosphingobium sp. AAP83 TaxID=1523425 RepID=UPI0018D126DD|nr:hypothetical protein [Novosphingobium sp. AAP83]